MHLHGNPTNNDNNSTQKTKQKQAKLHLQVGRDKINLYTRFMYGGCSSVGRALGCGPRCREFKSRHSPACLRVVSSLEWGAELQSRARRTRQSPALRNLVRESGISASQLILPVFVCDGIQAPCPIPSMPQVAWQTLDSLKGVIAEAKAYGVGGIMLFAVPKEEDKDPYGSAALDKNGILARSIAAACANAGNDLSIMVDICLDEFTSHGHCGVLDTDGRVDNDNTCKQYARIATLAASCGAQVLGLSGMMDFQVSVVRSALDDAGFTNTAILAYSAKYASAFYGPFRTAVMCNLLDDRKAYQMDHRNVREGIKEGIQDEKEGADILLVKPASHYLDVLWRMKQATHLPVWAYQVSGEYCAILAAAQAGYIDKNAAMLESIECIVRAGASAVLTYFALDVAQLLQSKQG